MRKRLSCFLVVKGVLLDNKHSLGPNCGDEARLKKVSSKRRAGSSS